MPEKQELSSELRAKIDAVVAEHDNDATQIVGILLEVQDLEELHYVPEITAYYLAQKLSLPVTQIFDVINFYAQLSDKPRAKYPLGLCNSPSCRVSGKGAKWMKETLSEILGIKMGEATADKKFCLEEVSCYGACDKAPSFLLDGKAYGPFAGKDDVARFLNGLA